MTVSRAGRFLKVLLAGALIIALLGSCALPKTVSGGGNATPGVSSGGNAGGTASKPGNSGKAVFSDETPAPLKLPSLGSVSFKANENRTISGDFKDDGKGLTLKVTDTGGLTWTLTVPALAIKAPQTITMTALKDLTSSTVPGKLAGGVKLEPDGLIFDIPALLTVSGSGLSSRTILLSGNADGSAMDFAIPGTEKASAKIMHFSTSVADSLEDPQVGEVREDAQARYKQLTDKARELLNDKNIKVPQPPSLPMNCVKPEEEKADNEKLNSFVQAFNNPERDLLVQMLEEQAGLQLLGKTADYTMELRLLDRMVTKVNLLIEQYGKDIDKLRAIGFVAMRLATDRQLLGEKDDASHQLMDKIAALYENAIKELFRKLTDEHEYRVAGTIIEALRAAQVLSGKTTETYEEIKSRLEKAMHFDLEINYTLQIGTAKYMIKSTAPVSMKAETDDIHVLTGSGTGSLVSYRDEADPRITAKASDFKIEAFVTAFMPCVGTATISLDRFFTEEESYYTDKGELMLTFYVAEGNSIVIFNEYRKYNPYLETSTFDFPVTLNSGKVDAINETIQAQTTEGGVGTVEFKLVHTPQTGK